MASYQEVMIDLHQRGVVISQNGYSIKLKFPSNISHYDLVVAIADIMSSESLPFNGWYSVHSDKDNIILDLDCSDHPEKP